MTTPELIEFVKKDLASGVTREVITNKLKMQGWSDFDVMEVFNIVNQDSVGSIQSTQPTQMSQPVTQPISSQPVTPIETVYETTSYSEPTPSRKFLKPLIVVLVLLILVVGGAVVYGSGYLTSSDKLFSQLLNSPKENTSVSFDIDIVADTSNLKVSEDSITTNISKSKIFNFNMKGDIDMSDSKSVKFNNSLSLKSEDIEASIDSRAINGSFYMSLTKAPNIGFFSLKPFENKWIAFPYLSEDGKIADNPLLSNASFSKSLLSDMTDDQKKHIGDIVQKSSFIKITKKHLPVMINGSLSYHLDFDLDKEGIVSFMKEMTEYIKSIDQSTDELSSMDFDKTINSINNFHGEIWVGIFDHLPHKVTVNLDISNPEKPKDGSVNLKTTLLYSNWNKPVEVIAPSEATTVEELIASMFGGLGGEKTSEDTTFDEKVTTDLKPEDPKDLQKKSVMSSMRAQAELYFDGNKNSYKGFCKSKTEGAYVLAITLPTNSVYKCMDDINVWASWVELGDKSYFCSDSTGFAQMSKGLPKGTVCPK